MALGLEPGEGTDGPRLGQKTCSKGKDDRRFSKLTHCKKESMPFLVNVFAWNA